MRCQASPGSASEFGVQAGVDGGRTHRSPQRDPPPVLKTGEPTGTQPLPRLNKMGEKLSEIIPQQHLPKEAVDEIQRLYYNPHNFLGVIVDE